MAKLNFPDEAMGTDEAVEGTLVTQIRFNIDKDAAYDALLATRLRDPRQLPRYKKLLDDLDRLTTIREKAERGVLDAQQSVSNLEEEIEVVSAELCELEDPDAEPW